MVALRPLHVHPSGCQNWYNRVIGSGGNLFGYCSTLSIYIYEMDDFTLKRMIAGHVKPITGFTWSPHVSTMIATSTKEGICLLWNVETGAKAGSVRVPSVPCCIEWSLHTVHEVAIGAEDGNVYLWNTHPTVMRATVTHSGRSGSGSALFVRWNPKRSGLLAIGHADNHISIIFTSNKTNHRINVSSSPRGQTGASSSNGDTHHDRGSLADMQWDPLSLNYMIVAFKAGHVALWDMDDKTELFSFDRVGAGLTSIAWMAWAAGNFAVVNNRTGVVRVFNVSQKQPIDHMRIGNSGFSGFVMMTGSERALCSFQDGSVAVYHMVKRQLEFSTKAGHTETIFDCVFSPADPDTLATGSYDGSIKLWSAATMTHKATLVGKRTVIYCMSWNPSGSHLAASNSSGEVVVWDVSAERIVKTHSHHNSKAVYRLDWCTTDPQLIASSGADGQCVVFEAMGEGRVRHRLRHRSESVYGCRWSPHQDGVLVTGCQDGVVRVYDLSRDPEDPVATLKGHTARVFGVEWSPLVPGLVASSSDDMSVRVWTVTRMVGGGGGRSAGDVPLKDAIGVAAWEKATAADAPYAEVGVLRGHVDRSRGLLWNTEVPHLLISGSWDCSIRLWDTRSMSCIHVVKEHLADVYGLACHPRRPFQVVSSSRDTSLRVWLVDDATSRLRTCSVFTQSLDKAQKLLLHMAHTHTHAHTHAERGKEGDTLVCGGEGGGVLSLRGPVSQQVQKRLDEAMDRPGGAVEAFAEIFALFGGPGGTHELWRLVQRCLASINGRSDKGGEPSSLDVSADHKEGDSPRGVLTRSNGQRHLHTRVCSDGSGASSSTDMAYEYEEGDRVVHADDVIDVARQEAAQLESARMRGPGGHGSLKLDERLAAAALVHLQAGRLREYCELQIELNQWERAIAIAPGVGMEYWQDLCTRYASAQESRLSESAVPFYVACGRSDKAIDMYVSRKEYKKAFLLAKVEDQRAMHPHPSSQSATSMAATTPLLSTTTPAVAENKVSSPTATSADGRSVDTTHQLLRRLSSKLGDGPEAEREAREMLLREQARANDANSNVCSYNTLSQPVISQSVMGGGGGVGEGKVCEGSSGGGALTHKVAAKMAEGQYAVGEAVLSACCYLAVNDYATAIEKLRHSCEHELAYAVAHCFQHRCPQALRQTLDALAHHAELKGDTRMCIEILKKRYPDPSTYERRCMALVVARSSLSDAEVDELYAELGVHERVMEIEEGKGADDDDDDDGIVEEQLISLVLRRCHGSAARNGVSMLRRWLSAHTNTHTHAHTHEDDAHTYVPLDMDALRRLVHILWSINAGKLMERPRAELLAYLSYTGALLAIEARMYCLVTFLIRNCRSLVEGHRIKDFAIEDPELLLMEAQYALPGQLDKAMAALEDAIDSKTLNATQVSAGKSVLEALQEKRGKLRQRYRENWNKVSGDEFLPANIPTTTVQRHDASSALHRPTSPDTTTPTPTMITTTTTTTASAASTSSIARGQKAGEGGDARAPVRYILCGPTIFSSSASNAPQGDKDGELMSLVSNRTIQGPHVLLGDRTSAIALSEAYMLTEVFPFSPLNTGDRISIA